MVFVVDDDVIIVIVMQISAVNILLDLDAFVLP